MRAPAGLRLEYVTPAEYRSARWADVLGVATFHGLATDSGDHFPHVPDDALAGAVGVNAAGIPVAEVRTALPPEPRCVYEVWRCGAPAESGVHGRVRFRRSEDLLFGCIEVRESEVVGIAAAGAGGGALRASVHTALHEATTQAYGDICATLDAQACPHLVRVWNYLPDINRSCHGTERYRQFNTARQQALRAGGRSHTGGVPAASALGAASDSPLVIYFLAGRNAPVFVENPRQVSAYHYPRRYGTHSPAFSRATLLEQPCGLRLFVSGTASIVGHRSRHVGDIAAQTRETVANIEALLRQANRAVPGARFSLGTLACKVYVRRPADLPVIRRELGGALGAAARTLYLQADICREDLLVEIEATAMCPSPGIA